MVLPVLVRGLGSLDLLVCFQLVLVELKVSASDDVVVAEASSGHFLNLLLFLLLSRWPLVRCCIMMLLQRQV